MGSKLAILAAQLIAIGGARIATAESAAELMKQGVEAYKAGKYDEAAKALERAFEIDHKPEALFALAQAERLGGRCDKAIPHYKTLLDQTTDLAQARLVQNNLGLCETKQPKPEPKSEPVAPPVTITKTVVREVQHTDMLATSMFAVGMLGAGVSVGLVLASQASRDDAMHARTLDDYQRLEDRADRDRTLSVVAAGVSAAAIGVAIFRWVRGGGEKTTEVAIAPSAQGSTVWVTGRW